MIGDNYSSDNRICFTLGVAFGGVIAAVIHWLTIHMQVTFQ